MCGARIVVLPYMGKARALMKSAHDHDDVRLSCGHGFSLLVSNYREMHHRAQSGRAERAVGTAMMERRRRWCGPERLAPPSSPPEMSTEFLATPVPPGLLSRLRERAGAHPGEQVACASEFRKRSASRGWQRAGRRADQVSDAREAVQHRVQGFGALERNGVAGGRDYLEARSRDALVQSSSNPRSRPPDLQKQSPSAPLSSPSRPDRSKVRQVSKSALHTANRNGTNLLVRRRP